MRALVPLFVWVLWFIIPFFVIRMDAERQKVRAKAEGTVDFVDRSPGVYVWSALLCGPLPLFLYFTFTRKNKLAGAGIGLLAAAGHVAVVGIFGTILDAILSRF